MTAENIKRAEQVLIDNGIESDEAETVLQAVGYALLGVEIYKQKTCENSCKAYNCIFDSCAFSISKPLPTGNPETCKHFQK